MTLAFVFPGQGAQSSVMLDSLPSCKEVKDTFQEASDALGLDIEKTIAELSPDSVLPMSISAPVKITANIACYRAWQMSCDYRPDIVAGHSGGEYAALAAAGVISFYDAVKSIHYCTSLQQEIHGAIASVVGLGDVKVIELCANIRNKTGKVIEAVNFNAPGLTLISGDKEAVELVMADAMTAGAKLTRFLRLGVPAHSSLLRPVTEKLHEYFKQIEFHTPSIPIINNVDVAVLTDPIAIKDALARHVSHPVRWKEIIKQMANQGIKQVVECGPGNVLQDLTTRTDSNLNSMSFTDDASLFKVIQSLNMVDRP
jgi:[acyl-carrier-protein] S-malonyltransferase